MKREIIKDDDEDWLNIFYFKKISIKFWKLIYLENILKNVYLFWGVNIWLKC
jgi:hypothetical protein